MRHPFAILSQSSTEWLVDEASRPSAPALPAPRIDFSLNRPASPTPKRGSNNGHYVKHSSKFTLLFNGQREGTPIPHYSNGDTIEGILVIARPGCILALDIEIEGRIYVCEVAGGGKVNIKTINDKVYSWSSTESGPFPPRVSFRYTLPTTYRDWSVGKSYPLPPTYSADLRGIPGFTVRIDYAVVVNLTRPSLWNGVNKWVPALPHVSNIRVPFRYSHRSRPTLPPPFPRSSQRTQNPRTLWSFKMRARPWKADTPDIRVDLYLPSAAVCCSQDLIPFHISLFADEHTLEPFAENRPPPSSFLTLSPSTPSLNGSIEAMQVHLSSRKSAFRGMPNIVIQRTTIVDTGRMGITVRSPLSRARSLEAMRDMFTRSESHSSFASGRSEKDTASMHNTRAIGQGFVHSASRRSSSIVWSGAIIIPPSAEMFNGGFEINGLQVVDRIMLSLEPPASLKSLYFPLHETVPLTLTSDSVNSRKGVLVSSLG